MSKIHFLFIRAANLFKRVMGCRVPPTSVSSGSIFLVLPCLLLILCDRTVPSVHAAGTVTAWGGNWSGQTTVPANLSNVVALAAGYGHSLALRDDGTVAAWGDNSYGQTTVPVDLSNVVSVASGTWHSLALRTDGTVAAWGDTFGQMNVPAGLSNVVVVAAGYYHNLALRANGTVAAWGQNDYGKATVPAGLNDVVAVAGGGQHSLALRVDGTVVMWGGNAYGQTNPPAGLSNVVAVAAGGSHSLALRADGTVVAWGGNPYGQTTVPADLSNVVAVAAGRSHSVALRADGTVAAWGYNEYGMTAVPTGLSDVVAVAAGDSHNLALTGPARPIVFRHPVSRTNVLGSPVTFSVVASGSLPLNYRWHKNTVGLTDGGNISGAATATLRLNNLVAGDAGGYSVVISNAFGSSSSAVAVLTVLDPGIASQPASVVQSAGDSITFSVTAVGTPPLIYQWWKDGAALAGATLATLTLTNLQGPEAGSYWVVVTNAFGAVTSSAAVLSILATLDASFNPGAGGFSPSVNSLAVQTDGKILVGGEFDTLAGQALVGIGRLNIDGTLDVSFNPQAAWYVNSLAVQGDGKIVVGGEFTTLSGQPRSYIGRLNADGTLDPSFDPGADNWIRSLAVQADGKILVGGDFTVLGGQARERIGRLNPDGTLDTSFNPGANSGGWDSRVYSIAVQADGHILVGGLFTTLAGQTRNFIGRLNADGTLDASFDPGADNDVYSLAVQADGKILVGGGFTILGGQTRNYIARLNADGTLDPSFDPGSWSGVMQYVFSIAVQTDGKIVVGGYFSRLNGQPRNFIGRLNADGTLDLGFDPGVNSIVRSLAVQTDGEILVGGQFTTLGGQTRNYIGRLKNSEPATQHLGYAGSTLTWLRGGTSPEVWRTTFDYSLNGNDWITLGAGSRITGGWQLSGVSIPIGASLSARGYTAGGQYNGSSWFVESMIGRPGIRLQSSQLASRTNDFGTTATFGVHAGGSQPLSYQWYKNGQPVVEGGKICGSVTPTLTLSNVWGADAGAYSVVVSNALGISTSAVAVLTVRDPVIAGQPASLFQNAGDSATFNVTVGGTPPMSYQWWRDGALLAGATDTTLTLTNLQGTAAGSYWVVITNAFGAVTSSVAVLILNLATLDASFNPGAGGFIYPDVRSLAVQTDGKILVGGYFTTLGGQPRNYIGRLNADGMLDTSFNAGANNSVSSLGVQADGKILVGGEFTMLDGQPRIGIGRLNADGTLDTGFNPGTGGAYAYVNSIAVQADGKILVGGQFTTMGGQPRNFIGRLNADGTLDASFSPGAGGAAWYNPSVNSIVLQTDGKILVGGRFDTLGGQPRFIGRLYADGTLDTSFNPGAGGSNPRVNSLAVQADGRILVAGYFTWLGGQPRNYIGRLKADGTVDASFNPGANDEVRSLGVQTDGKILLGGWFSMVGGQPRYFIGRLNADGTLDTGFNPGAVGTGGYGAGINSIAVQADGKVLVGGEFTWLGGQPRDYIGRLNNIEPVTQHLGYDGSTLTWLRGGTSPEVWWTTFDYSLNGTDWTAMGAGTRISGGWQLAGMSLPAGSTIRARGQVTGGRYNGSGWFVQSMAQVIAQAPFISSQPVSKVVVAGDAACFSVGAAGIPPFVYQWLKNGTNAVNGGSISGATSSNLCLSPVQPSDAGRYSVVVTNIYGSVTGSVAMLTVLTNLAAAQSDDFSGAATDPTKWGPDIHLGAGGQLVQTNGQLQFRGDTTVLRPWIGSYGSYTQDWEVIAEVNVGSVALTQDKSYARVFLGVADHNDTMIQDGWPGDAFSIALNVYYETPGPISRVFESIVQTNGVVVNLLQGTQNTTNQNASLRISFNAATKELTAWYDLSGNTNSHSWIALSSLHINGADVNWAMTDASSFRFALGASSRAYAVTATDQVYGDNLSVLGGVQLGAPLFSNPGKFAWARRVAKTSLTDDELAMGMALDSATNLYVAGWFDGTNDFGGVTLTSYGGQDAFIAKYDSSGVLQWVRRAGGPSAGWDCARGVGVDAAGNVYVTGGFLGTATFNGTSLTSLNNEDCFIAKYDSGGMLRWVSQGSDSLHSAYGTGIAVDSVGNSLVVGYFEGQTVSFGGITATNAGYASSAYAAFISKYNSAGTVQWALGLGGGDTYSTTVGMDAAGNCYVAGSFQGTLQLGTTNLTSAGDQDGFLAKFDSAGVLQWVRQVAGPSSDSGRLGVDAAGNSWLVGNFTGSASIGATNLTSPSGYGFFVARYDTSGNLQWVRQADSPGFLGSEGGCAIDASGNCYIPGIYSEPVNFGDATITNRGGWDFFVAKYDAAGDFHWVQTAGGSLNDGAFKLAVDAAGACYVAGWFQWIPAFGTNLLQAQGYWDTFLAKLGEPAIPLQFWPGPVVSNGWFHARLIGPANASVVVDTSLDLTTWTPWQTNTLPAGGLPLAMPMGTNRQFFRARIPQP